MQVDILKIKLRVEVVIRDGSLQIFIKEKNFLLESSYTVCLFV